MQKIRRFFKDVFFYSGSNLFANVLNFITGIVVRRVLQPVMMGLFNEIMLIFDYSRYSHFGMINSLDRELPYFYGRKDYKKVELIRDIGFTVCLIIVLCVCLGLFIASFFMGHNADRLFVIGVRIVSLMVVFRLISSLYIVLNRSRNRFSVISIYTILVAVLDILTKVILVIKFGLYGLLWASVLTWFLGLIYFYKASGEKFRFTLNFPSEEAIRLFKIGFPIFVMELVVMNLRNIDRIMIIRLLDRENLGFYTIALMVSAYLGQVPSLIYAVIFPRFYQAYGKTQNIFEIKGLFEKPILIFAYFFPILIGVIILVLPLLIHYVLPAYTPGLLPAYLLLLGCSFISLVAMPGYLLIALNKQIYMVVIGLICIGLGIGLNYLFVRKFDFGLSGIAIGTSVTYFFYTTILIAYAFRHYTKRILSHLKFFATLYLPILWVVVLLLILQVLAFKSSGSIVKDLSIVLYREIAFLLCCSPLILYVNKKTAILSLIKNSIFRDKTNGGL